LPKSPIEALRAAAGRASGPAVGAFWVTISMALLAGLAVFSRAMINVGVHPFQVVFLRNLFAVLMLVPLLVWRGPSLAQTDQLGLYFSRVLCSLVGMLSWFYALSIIPIGEVTAISFLSPLFGTLGAIFLLGETVRWRRWAALVVGFAGAMIILRPSDSSIGIGQLCAIFSAMSMGLTVALVKQLTGRDDPDKIVFLTNLLLTPMSLLPALFVWRWVPLTAWPYLLGMGLCAVLGHITLVRGYAATDASLAQTFEFSRLPFVVLLGYLAFAETIDTWTWVGALIIFSSAVYITRRESRLAARRVQADDAPP
jgi:drug/metabolite transporter (DMT)-like permease